MKKLLICIAVLLCTVTAQAQFEQNKWLITPSITGLGMSYSGQDKFSLGFEAEGGVFLMDNFALLINAGADIKDRGDDRTSLGAGVRYYFEQTGIYVGSKFKYDNYDFYAGGHKNDATLGAEVGYAYFLSRTVTVEPAIYYNQSLTDHDYSKFGVKIGFGFYF